MTIKSDKWITTMSMENKMIEPFSSNQVRLDEKGQKLISYGVSSYGYDVGVQMNLRFLQIFILLLLIQNHSMKKVL